MLPLKIWSPQTFDGTALCIGSMIPDLDLLLPGYRVFHALESLLILLPVTLLLIPLMDRFVLPHLAVTATRRPGNDVLRVLRYFGIEAWTQLQWKRLTSRWLLRATYSALIGIGSHFLLDLPTHHWITYLRPFFDGPMPPWFLHVCTVIELPVVGAVAVTRARVLQWVGSVGWGVVTLYCLRYIHTHQLLDQWYSRQSRTAN